VEIISVTASTGYDANTGEATNEDEKDLPSTVTFLVRPEQAKVLAELEQDAKIHLTLVYRGTQDVANAFITAQDELIEKLYPTRRKKQMKARLLIQPLRTRRKARRLRTMNFKKRSIFHRGADDEPEQEVQAESGGMLAVWGSPGSGKTITAVKLAKALADKKKNVALLLCDMTAPMLPCICPPSELECEVPRRHPRGAAYQRRAHQKQLRHP
jgi:flagellar biosynthesis GTPase FlhF